MCYNATINCVQLLLFLCTTGHQLQVTALQGMLGEELSLVERLEADSDATKWLTSLEQLMRTSLTAVIQECVIARFDGGKTCVRS